MHSLSVRALRGPFFAAACLVLPAVASATPFTIDTTVSDVQSLGDNETGTVTSTGDLSVSDKTPDVTFTGTGAELDNSGTIEQRKAGRRAVLDDASGNHSFTINNETSTSKITAGGDAIHVGNDLGTGMATLTNNGTISSTGIGGDNGQAVDFDKIFTGSATITNGASGRITSADADAIRPGNNSTISNSGEITSHFDLGVDGTGNASKNDAIDYQDVNAGTVHNMTGGTITGAHHGVTGKVGITVTNASGATITGNDGSGLNMDTTAATGTTTVTNSGTISGHAVSADGDGIDTDYLLNLDNHGTVSAIGVAGPGNLNEALAIGGGTIHNFSDGTITSDQRAITVDDSNLGNAFGITHITNEGMIEGKNGEAIKITSNFADTLDNAGTIKGSVAVGTGDDVLTLHGGSSITGAVSAAGGSNAIHLMDAGTGTSGLLTLNGGAWNVDGDGNYQGDIALNSGRANLSGTIKGDVTVNGGVLDPTVTIDGNLTIASGILLLNEGDKITINGMLQVGGSTIVRLLLNDTTGMIDLADFLQVNDSTGMSTFDPAAIQIFSSNPAVVGRDIQVTFTGFGTDQTVTAQAPEPGPAAILIVGLLGMATLRRRHRGVNFH